MRKILIDGIYRNNIRVATTQDGELEDFEFEGAEKENMRGNIYLAKVSRVENSLQAAFIDYGGEKNGFLSFSEIHPDYFQIPKEDKEKFMKEMSFLHEQNEDEPSRDEENKINSLYKTYHIGEVIKKDQLLLVQVIKEERGNKGVSLTTYLTFPGRYFVLMTNTPKKIGISKKIAAVQERGRIRDIVNSFNIAKTSGIVVRTAAEGRTKEELLKDYNYLASLWNDVREKTVKSEAPAFIHKEETIVNKILREQTEVEIKEIVVEGEELFNEVTSFSKNLGYDKDVKIIQYIGKTPIFTKFGIETKIARLFEPKVEMASGAYLIIQQTEALVSIDVNSGRVTSGNNVEETALQTNLEAAKEIARQLKLRKLAGLIVVDFIDMMKVANRILVENEIKNHLMKDKARVHVGRISQFGLLELSRQRTDQNVFEASGVICPECEGSGFIKSPEYISLNVLKNIASHLASTKAKFGKFTTIFVTQNIAIHIMNFKRNLVKALEERYNTKFIFYIDNSVKSEGFRIENSPSISIDEVLYSENFIERKEEKAEAKKQNFFDRLFKK